MKGFVASISLLLASSCFGAGFSIVDAYPSDINGERISPKLGEAFYVTTKLEVGADLAGAYRVSIDGSYTHLYTGDLSGSGSQTVVWGQVQSLTDGDIPLTISVRSGPSVISKTLTVKPIAPLTAIELYDSRSLQGSVSAIVALSRGAATNLEWWLPQPFTAGSQQRIFLSNPFGAQVKTATLGQPVSVSKGGTRAEIQFGITASNVRVNPLMLNSANWTEMRRLPSSITPWLNAETMSQPKASVVNSFVNAALPLKTRAAVTPYQAAKTLFQATVKALTYDGAQTKPDATRALQSKRGDCGSFASVFVASCRNVGIPARTVVGMVEGDNQWHVWAEFYLPRSGWIPADPSFADGIDPAGTTAPYFGVLPNGNTRAILTYGFDHTIAGKKMTMLQAPALFLNGATAYSFTSYCTLRPMNQQ